MKPWLYWLAFGVAVALGFGALLWLTDTVLELDHGRANARQQAVYEESVRLALWRMETAVAPILARESARSYLAYEAFHNPERAYDSKAQSVAGASFLLPSALTEQTPDSVLVHFQLNPDGSIGSPQVPVGLQRDLSIKVFSNSVAISEAQTRLSELNGVLRYTSLVERVPASEPVITAHAVVAQTSVAPGNDQGQTLAVNNNMPALVWDEVQAQSTYQNTRNVNEWSNRMAQQQLFQQRANPNKGGKGQAVQSVQQDEKPRQSVRPNEAPQQPKMQVRKVEEQPPQPPSVSEGLMRGLWIDGRLVLARRVMINGEAYVQGCWLDWDKLCSDLLSEVDDLLPNALLVPAEADDAFDSRRLAALPIRLVPGPAPVAVVVGLSPARVLLLLTWAALAMAAGAMAFLLAGAIRLSEKRAAFVSAVTHELRTPLTTFRMYAEMLAEGMVPDPAKREHYLRTLCAESNRLTHLVENVLAYARLERGRLKSRAEQVSAQGVVDRVLPRLEQRAQQAGMVLAVESGAAAAAVGMFTDVSAVEQVLFNLVDNACKYAAKAEDKRIHLSVQPTARDVVFRVWDHGPGISREDERRLFRPFSKSAQRAAESAPGVGLGLALCRRLARQIGGRLTFVRMPEGACFELALPQLPAERWQAA